MLIDLGATNRWSDCNFLFLLHSPQFCASSQKEAEEWVEQIDFVLRGLFAILLWPSASTPAIHSLWGLCRPIVDSDYSVSVGDEADCLQA